MNLTHNLRNNSRALLNLAMIGRIFAAFSIILLFVLMFFGKDKALGASSENKVLNNSRSVYSRLILAKELETVGKTKEARGEITTALDLDRNHYFAQKFYADNLTKSEDLRTQIHRLEKVVALRPDYQKAWAKLATLFELVGEETGAQEARIKSEELKR